MAKRPIAIKGSSHGKKLHAPKNIEDVKPLTAVGGKHIMSGKIGVKPAT